MRLYSHAYVRGTVSSRISHFMCKGGSIGFRSKINAEIRIQLETTIHCINLHLKQQCCLSCEENRKRKKCYSQSSPHLLTCREN